VGPSSTLDGDGRAGGQPMTRGHLYPLA
jgi:hypothetical protein